MPIPQLNKSEFRIRKIGARISQFKKSSKPPIKSNPLKKLAKHWLPILVIIVILILIAGFGVFAWASKDLPEPDKIIQREVPQSTRIYARDEKTLLYEIHGPEKRTLIPIEEIPENMIHATIAIEDQNFYHHKGFDIPGIMKAVCHEILGNMGGLCPKRGGSTITQQFVKNAVLTSERSYNRKIKELILSYRIEQKFTKDQILQMYFNEIPFGSTLYGVEAASQAFFGKSVRDINLAEAAFLASLPQRPTYLSPYGNHTDELSKRLHLVLDKMEEMDYITKKQAEEAKKVNLLEHINPKYENITAPHFVMYVKELLTNKYGEKRVEQGGLKVVTTLNIDKQRIAEEAVVKYAEKNYKNYNASNAALVSLDTKTGQILAMVGSRDYFNKNIDGNVNVALRPRQPGSSFKPIVYLTAFEKGYTPDTILFDLVTKFKTASKDYEPKNYDLKEHGPVTMRQALAGSLNIPAVKTLYLAGIDNVLDTAEKLGYTTLGDRSRFGLSLVLGGGEVTLLEHTSAFATLAREGIRHPVSAILKVEDKNGKILEEYKEKKEKVLDSKIVRILNNVLSDDNARAYVFGLGSKLTLPSRPVAAKTGTTNDYRDAWTIGYTPSIATGVWVGNNNNSEMRRGAAGAVVAAPIWHEYMARTVGGPVEPFKTPEIKKTGKAVLDGDLKSGTIIKVDKVTGLKIPKSCLDGYPKEFVKEETLKIYHNILFYINKDDPLGPPPSDPSADPQYNRWEEPVQDWVNKNNFLDTEPKEGDCDIRNPENMPRIKITAPENNSTISKPKITIKVETSGKYSTGSVDYYLNNEFIGTNATWPFSLDYNFKGVPNGFYDLKAVVYDIYKNSSFQTISINYLYPENKSKPKPINANSNTNSDQEDTNSTINTNSN